VDFVYCIVFDNKIAKFGKTTNLLRRLKEHDSNARHHGARALLLMASAVTDGGKEEFGLLRSAKAKISQVSQESFKFENSDDLRQVFRDCRLPYMVMTVDRNPLRLIYSDLTLSGDFDLSQKVKMTKFDNDKYRISSVLSNGWMKFESIRDSLRDISSVRLSSALCSLVADGEVERKNAKNIWTLAEIDDIKQAGFKITDKA